ncbi:MAG: GGDEF domain-containing protein [Pseudomonadota bacterium]|nr:GGDEF domain-containing protein [Pseudomonadota bacterium]
MTTTLADRAAALLARMGALAWLYALVAVPLATDWIENGALPTSPRGWITEVVGGIVIGALVTLVRRNQIALEKLARSDGLTGLFNRRAFEIAVDVECARARRSGAMLSVVYLDIDHFKRVNDRFGHAAGDQVLRQVAHAIGATIRSHVDGGFRLGGDEFALLLPASSKEQAARVVDRIRDFCAGHDSLRSAGALDLSAGIVEFAVDEAPSELIRRSDAAMYLQKQSRRDGRRARLTPGSVRAAKQH